MISFCIWNPKKDEVQLLLVQLRRQAAVQTDAEWKIRSFHHFAEWKEFLLTEPLLHLCCYDISQEGTLDCLENMRRRYDQMWLLIIADPDVSPLSYLRPSIRPDSLLIRPLCPEKTEETLEELIRVYLEKTEGQGEKKQFLVENRDERVYIPYEDIYYFEAREKKIYVRTAEEEFGFYDTMDGLKERLPPFFQRCHRSYIVNGRRIAGIVMAENRIRLKRGFDLPLSRSYKAAFRQWGKQD